MMIPSPGEHVPESDPGSPISPLSTSDSEDCNTASSRVHFGPLRSTEKKFMSRRQTLHPTALNNLSCQHLPMSTVVSSPPTFMQDFANNSNDSDTEECNQNHLRGGTPDNDRFSPDEPSSVLATRIIRAQDNPSPPPSTRAPDSPAFLIDAPEMPITNTLQFSSPSSPSFTSPERKDRLPVLQHTPSRSPPLEIDTALQDPPNHDVPESVLPQLESRIETSPNDLISFDSFSAPSPVHIPSLVQYPIAGPSAPSTDSNVRPTTVDDLLLRSPSPAPRPSPPLATPTPARLPLSSTLTPVPQNDEKLRHKVAEDSLIDNEDHAAVSALSLDNTEDASRTPPLPTIAFPILPSPPHGEGGQPQTPIRRSTRPRRSVSPYSPRTDGTGGHRLTHLERQLHIPPPLFHPPVFVPPSDQKRNGKEKAESNIDGVAHGSSSQSGTVGDGTGDRDVSTELRKTQEQESPKLKKKRREYEGSESSVKMDEEAILGKGPVSLPRISADVVTQSVPPDADALQETRPGVSSEGTGSADRNTPLTPSFLSSESIQPQQSSQITPEPTYQTPDHSKNVTDSSNPVPYIAQRSPPKSRLAISEDPSWSPARRIPVDQAVAQGHFSPQKAAQYSSKRSNHGLGAGAGTATNQLRAPVFNIRSATDSPARRVPISSEVNQARLGSPVRATSRERSLSAEPRPLVSRSNKGKCVSVDEQDRLPSTSVRTNVESPARRQLPPSSMTKPTTSKLPFSLVPARDIPDSIPEEPEPSGTESHDKATSSVVDSKNSSPPKSNLRQPSFGSRIPRIGAKPYARPKASASKANQGKSSVETNTSTIKAPKPFRMVQLPSGSGSSSDEPSSKNVTADPAGDVRAAPPSRDAGRADHSILKNLKRKREAAKSSSEMGDSVLVLRQVGPSQPNPNYPAKAATQVPFWKSQALSKAAPNGARPAKNLEETEFRDAERQHSEHEDLGLTGHLKAKSAESSPPSSPSGSGKPIDEISASEPKLEAPSFINDNEQTGKVRRTKRPRRLVRPSSSIDMFGSVDVRPLQSRRKVHPYSSFRADSDVFSEMSAVALRALTSSNTARNQKYVAANLETQVIRKGGPRPDSPTVKMKTISQRQEEERERQRLERAERRARRSEDGLGLIDLTPDQNDPFDSSIASIQNPCNGEEQNTNDAENQQRHRRGPGDEEDYETPERPAKRSRYDDDDDAVEEKKQVKWDRGLSTAIFLEEVRPRTRHRPKEDLVKKGCLAKTSKTLCLDFLGNLPNADAPLADLVHENIVVKKFVYDNDLQPSARMVVVKNTRSKNKKGKY